MPPGDLIVGVSGLHFQWESLPEAFARAGDFGFDLIEFSTTQLGEYDYTTVARLARQTGIGVSLHAWGDLAQMRPREAVEELEYLLEVCRHMTARHLILHLGSHAQPAIGLERLAQSCRAVAATCEETGVIVCLENHYPYDYHGLNELGGVPEDFRFIFEFAPSPALGFCLDYGHAHMSRNTPEFLQQLGPKLAYTHIADNLGENDDHLAPEDGTIDWPDVLGQTLATGFRGPFTIEFPEQGDPERFARFVQLLKQVRG